MKKKIRSITQPMINHWRKVDLRTTRLVANACCIGIDFRGCSKSDILRAFVKGTYPSADMNQELFIVLMNEMVAVHERAAAMLDEQRNLVLHCLPQSKLVDVGQVSTRSMVSGNEKKFTTVVDQGHVKDWVGFGWIPVRPATSKDYKELPVVARY